MLDNEIVKKNVVYLVQELIELGLLVESITMTSENVVEDIRAESTLTLMLENKK